MSSRNAAVDIAKFLAAIFVIGIHTRPLSEYSFSADFILCDIVFRTAVPFFAVCTGYFLTKRMLCDEGGSSFWRHIRTMDFRVLKLYIIWSLFFFILLLITWNSTGLLTHASIIGWFKSFLIGVPYYHLWYLAQLFWALLFFYPIFKYTKPKWQILFIIITWSIGAFVYVYADVLGLGHVIFNHIEEVAITGSILRILPLLLAGSLLARNYSLPKRCSLPCTILFFICLSIEVFLLKMYGASRFSYVLFTMPLAYCLFEYVRQVSLECSFDTRLLSKASMNIYLLHPAVLELLKIFKINSNLLSFIITVILTSSICIVGVICLKHRRVVSC